jgi:hypothetical protein
MNEHGICKAGLFWRIGMGTHVIAAIMKLPEHVIYNNIDKIKKAAKQ